MRLLLLVLLFLITGCGGSGNSDNLLSNPNSKEDNNLSSSKDNNLSSSKDNKWDKGSWDNLKWG